MNIVVISYRIAGNDGVSLECVHWKEILEKMGHKVTFLAGQLDRAGIVMPELHFQWPNVMELHDRVVYGKGKYRQIEAKIFDIAGTIEGKLRHFFNGNRKVDLLVVANIFSLPMHFPLAVALTRVIEELGIPTIARHHDFWWERKRYIKSQLFPFFERWFPPKLAQIKHVVINSIAKDELKAKTGLEAEVIWDSFDFSNEKLSKIDRYSLHFKKDFGIRENDIVFLQSTRIVPRKRVELSIEFIKKLADPRAILILSGHAGDEGRLYLKKIKKHLKTSTIRYKLIGDFVNSKRRVVRISNGLEPKRARMYTMWDCYRNSDFVLYPTKIEGFGNQFIESVYFRKPIIITSYPVYDKDIKPLGFETIGMRAKPDSTSVNKVRHLLEDSVEVERITKLNFGLGKKYFSYEWVQGKLEKLFGEMNLH
ncbi:hypothetical protein A2962_01765 [Candidatus Woesebacteria bacterium RIFCSPLOWO2_01_FULL_39_61]|uniref:Glycosyl transferase family 1 domain-containing protein n=1 Tax=Candidatus Woesebacteria bacterium RIFCSPHIGHO2_02_FULL_39_13 TaxID=1802505 RepID=A0A1F7Z249_9BACT|nr:MAG: hypothetical protein A2692_02765 [Candidatus Woesebacteria bacterium RIFCSPHIGHO2_01_FULL_39_95]OGM33716.1 MAG: hypothetical protein A3D01_06265 [Candidatus Woesebacteria bacterium RIFCSPHIGHO2_02_FULL_39_13]OGM38392.1 MAG: hypothetical protein A3E13_01950 [Candidatus Woesebacteria bacterium RIFCSPHIGHO2_12_FULL_40_20]OGM66759.1 MAG: hypothetical protein A2962_01765 [Candidatus Woesebacteria bacterium RIFCSPLOWO2_01_FULL_39_61]OGM74742.1 MAG: hypothetical protein A3H19_00170 [Candidatus